MIILVWPVVLLIAGVLLTMGIVVRMRPVKDQHAPVDEHTTALLAAGLLPLAECPQGRDACLRCLQVDRCVIHRLLELGLTPGTRVRVVQDAGGPMLLAVRGSRVALGRDLAERMWVELPELEAIDLPLS
ncbi:MAG: ferrous iron transport protein A [Anaerolineales bacterium]|uniref:FeoA family protein n=1 Tax=Promineifilum sp. TaxID=2664178 RepID=UPI001D3857F5|nr:ferrous iron transport protein A [Anaerolineales bacterium]MCO5180263.1 ferrous iron transport protein A [Promineifilum sp.]